MINETKIIVKLLLLLFLTTINLLQAYYKLIFKRCNIFLGCVDVWDPKVIRSAAGAHFRLPIYHSLDWNEMPTHLEKNTSIFVADSNTTTTSDDDSEEIENFERNQLPVLPYYGVDFSTLQHTTLIIGGETEGISQDSYK